MAEIHSFGYWVRRRRKALDLTQDDLADQVGCATVTIRKIEMDVRRPSLQIAERLADCLVIPASERALFLQVARAERATDRLAAPDSAIELDPTTNRSRMPAELPSVPNALIGRAEALAEIGQWLQQPHTRLITLTGPGGVGKTRLAIAIAQQFHTVHAYEVWFVSLAAVSDPALVVATIAQACGLPNIGTIAPLNQLITFFEQQECLLVLDNFEQVLAAASQIALLLAATNGLRIVLTSRAPLRIAAEHEYAVLPLETSNQPLPPAVELFCARAQSVHPGFVRNTTNQAILQAICTKLDGLPLAIELAAARIRVFSPTALLARLDHRLSLLTSGARDSPARQQTLRSTMAWSYDLLRTEEQLLFAQLSVFMGGFSLEAVEAVANVMPSSTSLVEALDGLVAHSLVQRTAGISDQPRFTMLESIREYAAEILVTNTLSELVAKQHADYFLQLAARIEPRLFGTQQQEYTVVLQEERANLIAALEWTLGQNRAVGDPIVVSGLQLASALWWFWYLRGDLVEGRAWIERGMACAGSAAQNDVARAGNRAAALSFRLGEYQRAAEAAMQSLQVCESAGMHTEAAFSRGVLALAVLLQGDIHGAEGYANAALSELDDTWGSAVVLIALGVAARFQGQFERANTQLNEALLRFRRVGDVWGTATTLGELGLLNATNHRDWNQAAYFFEESLALSRSLGDQLSMAHAMHRLGRVARQQGNIERALVLMHEQLVLFQVLGDRAGLTYAIWEAAVLEAIRNKPDQAARLFGLAETLRGAINLNLASDRSEYEAWRAQVRTTLGEAQFAAAFATGAVLPLEQVRDTLI